MNIKPQTTQPISDDQELAKVLAGVNDDAAAAQPQAALPPTPPPMPPAPADDTAPASVPAKTAASAKAPAAPASSGDASLDAVKKDAITELRPLVDKLNIAPDEKFDTVRSSHPHTKPPKRSPTKDGAPKHYSTLLKKLTIFQTRKVRL